MFGTWNGSQSEHFTVCFCACGRLGRGGGLNYLYVQRNGTCNKETVLKRTFGILLQWNEWWKLSMQVQYLTNRTTKCITLSYKRWQPSISPRTAALIISFSPASSIPEWIGSLRLTCRSHDTCIHFCFIYIKRKTVVPIWNWMLTYWQWLAYAYFDPKSVVKCWLLTE
jgi:hypothetical protein